MKTFKSGHLMQRDGTCKLEVTMKTQNLNPTFKPGMREQLTEWTDSPETGDPRCLCSYCKEPFEEDDMPLRMWPEGGRWEIRLHIPKCTDLVIDWGGGK